MASLVLKTLSIFLGLFFIFVGLTKITPKINGELHRELAFNAVPNHLKMFEGQSAKYGSRPDESHQQSKILTPPVTKIHTNLLYTSEKNAPILTTKRDFVKYSKVIPFLKAYNIKIHSRQYRSFVGGVEISCGTVLAFLPFKRMKQTANCLLLLLMLFTMYTHVMVGDRFERTAPSLVFLFMLVCRLIVDYQVRRQERLAAAKAAASASNSAPAAAAAPAAAPDAGDAKTVKTE